MCEIYRVITGAITIQLKNVLIENHSKRQEERRVENEQRSDENLRLAVYTVLCTLGLLIFLVLLGAGGLLIRKKCVKAAEREKQKDLLLKKLVEKTNDIERGLNEEGGSTED